VRHQWLLVIAFAAACGGPAKDQSRERVASALRDSLGDAADPQVAIQRDSAHLLVHLATVAFPTASDSALTEQARHIGSLALRHYDKSNQLDSVSVLYREKAIGSGIWHIRHERTFPVESLRNVR
jgi:hypothetical protein